MKNTYHIEGMTCSGCEAKVKSDLSKIENVTQVEVSKEDKLAVITMSNPIELKELQEALGGNESNFQISLPNSQIENKTEAKGCCTSK